MSWIYFSSMRFSIFEFKTDIRHFLVNIAHWLFSTLIGNLNQLRSYEELNLFSKRLH